MDDFERQIHAMFDHIWNCEIDHPAFQDTVGELMSAVIQCHKNTPSAQPERNKGRWIDMDDHVMCSCCGATHYGADKNYCPNCGADMRGEENDSSR